MEPLERRVLKIQKREDDGHGIKFSKEEITLDGKTETEEEGCVQKQVIWAYAWGSGRQLPSESHPVLYEADDKTICYESEERSLGDDPLLKAGRTANALGQSQNSLLIE